MPERGREPLLMASDGNTPLALEVQSVSHAFGARQALDGVSCAIEPSQYCVLLGLNGAGKTTLFSLITRLYNNTSGAIRVFGHDVRRAPGLALPLVRYEDMGATPLETFEGIVRYLGLPEARARLERAMAFSSFAELERQETSQGFEEARPDRKVRFFRQGKVGAWRQALSDAQVQRLIEAHREVMLELGYLDRVGELKV